MIISVLDFETTGKVDHYSSEPWQIGLVQMKYDCILEDQMFESLLQVGDRPFNPYAPGNYHALRDRIAAAPSFTQLWPRLNPLLSNRPLCAHNIGTEKTILKQQAPLHQFGPWIDTLALARTAWPQSPSHKLKDLVVMLGLEEEANRVLPGRVSHDALYDALCSALLLRHILHQPGWNKLTIDSLIQTKPEAYYRLHR